MSAQMRGRSSGRGRHRPMADINVTPMVDVMLVLLVIFMITAPLLTVGVPVDLPKTSAATLQGQDEPLAVSVNVKGQIFLMETEVQLNELVPRLTAIANGAKERRIFVRGDKSVDYGRMLEVMGTINTAGFNHVALVAQPTDSSAAPATSAASPRAKR